MPQQVSFYHAVETDYFSVLVMLLLKSLAAHKKSLICLSDAVAASDLSDKLWQTGEDFILAHGLSNEAYATIQKILVSHRDENLNKADYIFYIGKADIENINHFERVIVLFDDHCPETKSHMRTQFQALRQKNITVSYYKQSMGQWVLH